MSYGGLTALEDVDLALREGEIVGLIGPNGAGKTTLFNCATGIHRPTGGRIRLGRPGKRPHQINGLAPHRVTRLGMARTFQNIRLFPNMTALENVMVGRHCRTRAGVIGAVLRGPGTRREEEAIAAQSHLLLENVGLGAAVNDLARNLPYGGQRRLEIARALATDPFVLLLDEPAAGMNPQETDNLVALIGRIRASGVSILLIEHDMRMVMKTSDRIVVLDHGLKIAEGTPEQIRRDPKVIKAYLGAGSKV